MNNLLYMVWHITPKFLKQFILYIILRIKFKKVIFSENLSFQITDILNNKIKIGENTFIGINGSFFAGSNNISIGKYCSIASDVYMITYNHSTEYISYHINQYENLILLDHETKKGDIIIGNDVWIGNRVTILSGVSILNGAIIGAGSIVTKDIQPYTIVGGNPAKEIKKRFQELEIKYIEDSQWWNWNEEKIKENNIFFNTKVKEMKI